MHDGGKNLLLVLLLMAFVMNSAAMRQTVLVTGSTDGIGLTTAKNMAAKGYNVMIHGRDTGRIERAVNTVKQFCLSQSKEPGRIIALPPIDISTSRESRRLADIVKTTCENENLQLSILMQNAGVFSGSRVITAEGLELTFAVNVVAPFVITSHLLPLLVKQKSRIVIASSISQCREIRHFDDLNYSNRPYSAHGAYSESKLLDAMLTFEMDDRLRSAGIGLDLITCNCLDPGTVNTKMLLAGWGPCGINADDALDETWLCTSDEVENVSGRYFVHRTDRPASASAYNATERKKLWKILSDISPESSKMWNMDWM